ncbi:hypothetical protein AVBRAN12642_06030 [Campylobacter sp. RM12642]|uniref:hypothetical protein n=1 Tax=Campylobacter sp. RM12642 TaxID=2735736 RepID=UPI003014B6FA|nr:hypothetical protein [Campylobacter sp. RM12642]
MKKIILLLISLNLFANNIINYNIYKRDDRIDVMLSFDSPYNAKDGDIRILSGSDYVGVVLNNVKISERNSQILNMPYAEQLLMYPLGESTVLEFKTKEKINVIPALTKDDGFGLRIRVMPKTTNQVQNNEIKYAEDNNIDSKLYSMIGVLAILVLILIFVKRQLAKKGKISNLNSKQKVASFLNINENQAVVICEKQLDKDNKFIVIDYENSRYKLIIGNTNIWLDAPNQTEENFESYFEENKQKLQNMIKQNALNSYKEKISKI